MSQFFIADASSVNPNIPTSFTTDQEDATIVSIPASGGSSTPAANIERLSGDNGIVTVSTPSAEVNNVTIRFIRGNDTTTGAATTDLITQPTLSDSTMTIQIIIAGYADDGNGCGAYGTAVVKNVAGTASLVGTTDLIKNSDTALNAFDAVVVVSGSDLIVRVTGVTGKNMNWGAALPGIVVSG